MSESEFDKLLAQIKSGNLPSSSANTDKATSNGLKTINEGLTISEYSAEKPGLTFRGNSTDSKNNG